MHLAGDDANLTFSIFQKTLKSKVQHSESSLLFWTETHVQQKTH